MLYRFFLKRILDLIISIIGFIVFSPLFIITLIFLLINNNGNPFFFQKRPGKNEKPFIIIKFKTMNDRVDASGKLLPDDKRLTRVGRFVRKASLDEIPQLINVIKGDMSIIGPRPLLMEYLPLYNAIQKTRHKVRPGITGWAQVNGRNAISWNKKLELDAYYILNISFILDVKIFFKTIKKVIFSEDISEEGSATIGRFKGNI
ncbi:MAG: lipopolysaccharide/colanic/teichoic acid biosynthesis glycosyltransferase [Flavobacteriaceae bacterium]|jgi:lipopolysaccharide/colanic/teichoic acid biosynthesis glycosyltransferase